MRRRAFAIHRIKRPPYGKDKFVVAVSNDVGGQNRDTGITFDRPLSFRPAAGGVEAADATTVFPPGKAQLQISVTIDVARTSHARPAKVVSENRAVEPGQAKMIRPAPQQLVIAVIVKVRHHRLTVGSPDALEKSLRGVNCMDQCAVRPFGSHVINRVKTDYILEHVAAPIRRTDAIPACAPAALARPSEVSANFA